MAVNQYGTCLLDYQEATGGCDLTGTDRLGCYREAFIKLHTCTLNNGINGINPPLGHLPRPKRIEALTFDLASFLSNVDRLTQEKLILGVLLGIELQRQHHHCDDPH